MGDFEWHRRPDIQMAKKLTFSIQIGNLKTNNLTNLKRPSKDSGVLRYYRL